MKILYWIRYNLGKVFFIVIIVCALIAALREFVPSFGGHRISKDRPSAIDFRPRKEGNYNSYKRRPRKRLARITKNKTLKTETYVDPENEDQFTISDQTQALLVKMQKTLREYGVTMDDLLTSIEIYYDQHKEKDPKKKKEPTQEEIFNLLPPHIKELIPENKFKAKAPKKDKKKDIPKEENKNLKAEDNFGPDEMIEPDQNEKIQDTTPRPSSDENEIPREGFIEEESPEIQSPGEDMEEDSPPLEEGESSNELNDE